MKKILIFLLALILVISSCNNSNNQIESAAKIGSISSNDLKLDMYMFPPPEFLTNDKSVSIKYLLTNLGKSELIGKISIEDSPDNQQFGGIIEPAESDFSLAATGTSGSSLDILIAGAQDIMYEQDLNFTSFNTNVRYTKQSRVESNKFCLKYSPYTDINNCNPRGIIKTNDVRAISEIEYEYLDSNNDKINDKMTLKFSIKDTCEITTEDEDFINELEVYLKNIKDSFQCRINKNENNNQKDVLCINDDSLNLDEDNPYFTESVLVNFKYDCKLTLESDFIYFKRGG